ncbi:AraC family transcriptional regulator [Paenibacillus sp. N3/727]|uniref:helix-turn-helix domain-containing protein n=1 Tax=Paenibacillus sp. N3/727 TaxID=2925845 RepID=UPI001F52E89C|nr:AraC family transcriptional regulator [Paenibacillus sp. N3/727]UNK17104.1 AraC family transcriptional regulator [Paenibacillus sp. N3/727]
MGIHWEKVNVEELTSSGVVYFNSKMEMLEDLPCKMYKLTSQNSLWTHCHDYFQIWYLAKGSFVHTVNSQVYEISKGDIFVIPPFTLHSVEIFPDQEIEIYGCEFMPSFVNERLVDMPTDPAFFDVVFLEYFLRKESNAQSKITLDSVTEVTVRNVMNEMLTEYERRFPFFQIALKANLLLLLSILVRQVNGELVRAGFEKSEKYRGIMTRVVDYIHNHYHEDLKLNSLCSLSNLSRSTFCILFKEWTGRTFNRYVTDLRILQAMMILKQPELSVTDVCFSTGFNELSYFCRIFKKYTGISPTDFRKQAIK